MSFVNKFISVVFQQFSINNDEKILRITSEVYGKLLRLGGTKIAQIMEANVRETLKWLKHDSAKDLKKFSSLLALKELLVEAPYITFNLLFINDNQYFQLIWNLIRYPIFQTHHYFKFLFFSKKIEARNLLTHKHINNSHLYKFFPNRKKQKSAPQRTGPDLLRCLRQANLAERKYYSITSLISNSYLLISSFYQ